MVTSLRLLATLIAGLLVSSLVVALLPEPERPMMRILYVLTDVIVLNNGTVCRQKSIKYKGLGWGLIYPSKYVEW